MRMRSIPVELKAPAVVSVTPTCSPASVVRALLFVAPNSSARTTDAGEHVGVTDTTAGAFNSTGILLILMLLGAGAFYYFLRVRRSPPPDFFRVTPNS